VATKNLPAAWQPAKKLPTKLGDCIDLFAAAYTERKRREAEALEVKKYEDAIEEHIVKLFGAQELNGARGKLGSISLVEKDVPTVTDWDAFYAYIYKNQAWEMLQKRPGDRACQERWDAGEKIPGVDKLHKKDVRLTK
jgi:hypothetical protein